VIRTQMNVAFGSSMTGDISAFADFLKNRPESVSFTVDDGFRFDDNSYFRVLHQVEPPEILDIADRIIQHKDFYDLILAWNEKVLEHCPKAQFFPEAVCSWINRRKEEGAVYQPMDTATKQFAVSLITSDKTFCPGHKLRVDVYNALPESFGNLKVIKHMSPPRWPDKRTIIEPYMFHIGVENALHNNWFADKIVDAFIGMAVPIYWGCPNLDKYFNMDGVIRFNDVEECLSILKNLTPEDYTKRIPAMKDNFERAMKFVHTWDRIEEAIDKGILRKQQLNEQHTNAEITVRQLRRPKRPLCEG
jgi:hypothetical protein